MGAGIEPYTFVITGLDPVIQKNCDEELVCRVKPTAVRFKSFVGRGNRC